MVLNRKEKAPVSLEQQEHLPNLVSRRVPSSIHHPPVSRPQCFHVGVLSCCLFGACGRGHKTVQLLPMSRINQPLIKLILHKYLELLPLILCQTSLLHSFLPDLYLLFSLTQCFLICRWKTPRYLCCVPFHFKGDNKYIEFTRW